MKHITWKFLSIYKTFYEMYYLLSFYDIVGIDSNDRPDDFKIDLIQNNLKIAQTAFLSACIYQMC